MHNNNDEKNPIKQQSFSKIIKIKKSKESNENPEGNKSTTAFTEKDILAFFFYIQMCVCVCVSPSEFVAAKLRGYKSPGEGQQYHSHSSGGSREARPVGRLEAAEPLGMELDVLGPSI